MLIEHGARFSIHNNAGGKMLLNAVSDRNFGLCEKLLKDGMTKNTKETSNPSSSFRKAIDMIIQNELMETYDLLPKYFGNLKFLMKVVNETVIHDVIFKQNQKLCAKLVRDGVDINTRDNSGNFPIHIAALTGNKLILNLLLQNNASVNALNHTRQTVLHLAAKNGHKDISDTLQQHGTNDSADSFGKTAEDHARENGHYEHLYVQYFSMYS